MIYDIEKYLVSVQCSIEDVMRQLNDTRMKILLVVDHGDKLLGTISDGDIRRALLAGKTLADTIKNVMNKSPLTGNSDSDLTKLAEDMRVRNLSLVPILDSEGVPRALYQAQYREHIEASTVILMVGGEGQRLRPLTLECPKPMLKIGDQPILERTLFELVEQGFSDFYFCINYLGDQIVDHFGDGTKYGVSIRYVREKKRMGTAGALTMIDLLDDMTSPVLVMNGDLLTDLNYASMVAHHKMENAAATTCVTSRDQQIAYGVVDHHNGIVQRITEKPAISIDINAGIYCIAPQHIRELAEEKYLDMPDFLNMLIEKNHKCCTYRMSGFWLDIGSPDDLARANSIYDHSAAIPFRKPLAG